MMWICKVKKEWPWPWIGSKNGYFSSAFIASFWASKLLRLQIHSKRMSKSKIHLLDPRKFRITKLRASLWTKSRNIFPPRQNLSLPSLASLLLAVSSLYLCTRGKSSNLDPGGKCTCLASSHMAATLLNTCKIFSLKNRGILEVNSSSLSLF